MYYIETAYFTRFGNKKWKSIDPVLIGRVGGPSFSTKEDVEKVINAYMDYYSKSSSHDVRYHLRLKENYKIRSY